MEKSQKIVLSLAIIFYTLFFLDMFFTFLSVEILQIAHETNPFLIALWQHFGFWLGELVQFGLVFLAILIFFFISKNKTGAVFSIASLSLLCLLWLYVVINNLIIFLGK